ncbi:MAG TPA: hypothetical protein VF585_03640 [Chthoniobacterales bacterium]
MTTKTLALACLALLSVGCASTSPIARRSPASGAADSRAVRSLRWLDSADPQRDLAAALDRGDRRFIGVYGYAPFTPGVEPPLFSRVRYLNGTADVIEGQEHSRLNRLAYHYAETYNRLLLQRLKQ